MRSSRFAESCKAPSGAPDADPLDDVALARLSDAEDAWHTPVAIHVIIQISPLEQLALPKEAHGPAILFAIFSSSAW
jgi:hypothetical protein